MGTTKCGRYLNTRGAARSVSDFALVHSDEGDFKWRSKKEAKKNGKKTIRLAGGGHGDKGMRLLDKYRIEYVVLKTYPNGVRVGWVTDHAARQKRNNKLAQSWFPKEWTAKDIRRAGEHVAGLRRNRHGPDGKIVFGMYKGVRVGVIRTHGKIATIFPDCEQPNQTRRKRK